MGIKYLALPVPPQLVNIARISPGAFLADHHFWNSWRPPPGLPESLYLDRPWRDLQGLLFISGDPPRAAYELLRGDVEPCGYGWHPFRRVLTAEQVAAAASDLTTVMLPELYRRYLPSVSPDWAAIMEGRRDCVQEYLRQFTAFAGGLANSGMGLVYSIG